MKFRYFLTILAGAAALAACTPEPEAPVKTKDLAVTLEQTVLSVSKEGETVDVTVTATKAWTASSDSEWLTVSPAGGATGKTILSLTAAPNEGKERKGQITVTASNGDYKILTVIQEMAGELHGLTPDDPMTIAQVVEYINENLASEQVSSKSFYIKGVISQVVEKYDTKYGNGTWWMVDEGTTTPKFEVYRALYLDNTKYDDTSKTNIKEGDIAIVYGAVTNYKGTPETSANAAYLYKLESVKAEFEAVTVAEFAQKEDGASLAVRGVVTAIEDAAAGKFTLTDFSGALSVTGLTAISTYKVGDILTVNGKRSGDALAGSAVEKPIVAVAGKTLAEIAAAEDNPEVYYIVSGTIKSIASEDYGNLTLSDNSGDLYLYGVYPGWGATGDARKGLIAAKGLAVGDNLTVVGYKTSYNGTSQLGGSCYLSHAK